MFILLSDSLARCPTRLRVSLSSPFHLYSSYLELDHHVSERIRLLLYKRNNHLASVGDSDGAVEEARYVDEMALTASKGTKETRLVEIDFGIIDERIFCIVPSESTKDDIRSTFAFLCLSSRGGLESDSN